MSRPKPQVLLEQVNRTTYSSDQVLAAEGIWAVFFDNKPINLRTCNVLINNNNTKYRKVSFSNRGHAINLAKKLNTKFNTNKFSVVLLTQGETIYPNTSA